jgi:ketosteroid isomerase-like protein
MSQENVEVLKASLAAWNAGDMDAFRELNDPNVIMWPVEGWPEPGPFVGIEAVIEQFARQREAFDFDKAEPVGEFIGVGDRVLFRLSYSGSGRGPDASMEMTIMVTVRKGKIVYREYFRDHAEALEAVGLSEQAMSQERP